MYALTAPINVRNVLALDVTKTTKSGGSLVAFVRALALGGFEYPRTGHRFEVAIRNGICRGLQDGPTQEFLYRVVPVQVSLPTGLTDALAAMHAAGAGSAAQHLALEAYCGSVGLFPPGSI